MAQGTQLNGLWQPKWEGIQKRRDIDTHIADLHCCTAETNTTL